MPITRTLERFGELLQLRFERDTFTTEDSVRYTLFAALLEEGGLQPHDVILEQRHPSIAGAEIDTWAPTFGRSGLAAEFKYDRALPGGKNTPRTQKAGQVFHDLYRLGLITPEMLRVLIYLADSEMVGYFSNRENGLRDFFALERGGTFTVDSAFMTQRPASFRAAARDIPNVVVSALYGLSLPKNHELRIYEVRNLNSST